MILSLVVIVFVDRGVLATRIDAAVAREAELAEAREHAELRRHGELLDAIQRAGLSPGLPRAISAGMGALHKGIEALGVAIDGLPAAIHNRDDAGGPLSTAQPPVSGCLLAPLPPPAPPPRRFPTARFVPAPAPAAHTRTTIRPPASGTTLVSAGARDEDTTQAMSTKDLKQALSAAVMVTTTLLAVLTLGCSDPGPGPIPDAGADDAPLCTANPPGCPSCNTVYNSVGDPGTTPADLCSGTCSGWRWIRLQDCAFSLCSGSCGPGETLVPDYVWDPACEACLATKCDSAACKADK